jgi:hypothetical protein
MEPDANTLALWIQNTGLEIKFINDGEQFVKLREHG